MKKWICVVAFMGLLLTACSNGKEKTENKGDKDARAKRTVALLKKVHVSDDKLPEGLVEKGVQYVAKFAALGEKEAAAWEKRVRFPESIMPHQGKNKAFSTAHKALIDACGKEIDCKKVSASMGLGHFTIMGPSISLQRMFSRKIPAPEGKEGLDIFRLKHKGSDTVVFVQDFRGTAYERRGKAYLLLTLD